MGLEIPVALLPLFAKYDTQFAALDEFSVVSKLHEILPNIKDLSVEEHKAFGAEDAGSSHHESTSRWRIYW